MDSAEELHDENGVNSLSSLVLCFHQLRQRKGREPFTVEKKSEAEIEIMLTNALNPCNLQPLPLPALI